MMNLRGFGSDTDTEKGKTNTTKSSSFKDFINN